MRRTRPPLRVRALGTVRARAALVSVLVVAIAFTLSAYSATAVLQSALDTSVANTARSEALDISSFIVARGTLPSRLPISSEEIAAQIVARSGAVITSSRNVRGQPAMDTLHPAPGQTEVRSGVVIHVRRFTRVQLDLDNRFTVVAVGISGAPVRGTVLVAASLGAADHAVEAVVLTLLTTLAVVTLIVGFLVWMLTGWALRPVELVRSEVAGISAGELHRRVPEPAVDDEIGRLARTMNAMLARLEQANSRERQLVADVSHELRNPLAALRAQLEVAVTHPGDGSRELLEGAIAEVDRLSRLVGDLLTLARLDEEILVLEQRDVDLDEVVLTHASRLREHGRVQVSIDGVTACRIRGDETQLTRVVANLADNAERHARRRVRFAVGASPEGITLTVEDDGSGVPEADRLRIFERFVRLDTARTHHGGGAGLGLAIVREIVRAHGGEVWVEDAHPGARFVVRIARG